MTNKNKAYWTCPDCGSNLDHGENCDCKKTVIYSDNNSSNKLRPDENMAEKKENKDE